MASKLRDAQKVIVEDLMHVTPNAYGAYGFRLQYHHTVENKFFLALDIDIVWLRFGSGSTTRAYTNI